MKKSLFLTIAALSLVSCSKAPESSQSIQNSTIPTVETCPVTVEYLKRDLKLPGEILPYQDVPLYPKIPGFIQWIGVDRGSHVTKGQLLVKLIAPELDAQKHEYDAKVNQSSAHIEEYRRKLTTAQSLLTRAVAILKSDQDTYTRMAEAAKVPGVISGNELEIWQQKVEADKAELQARTEEVKAAEAKLRATREDERAVSKASKNIQDIRDYLEIRAPYTGMITERNMHEGSFAYPPSGQSGYPPMLRLKQNSLLRIVVPVPEYAVDGVKVGAKVSFTVAAYPNRTFVGEVARIAHSLEVKTRTEPVELNYWNPDRAIDPGMFPEIHWPMKRSYKTFFVPTAAVHMSLETPFIVCIRDGRAKRVTVRRGQSMGDLIEVFGDLKEGDLVAASPSEHLNDGQEVKSKPVMTPAQKTVPFKDDASNTYQGAP